MVGKVTYLEVGLDGEQQRLDNYMIKKLKKLPKSLIYKIIRSGEVRVNKKRAKPSMRLSCGDCIRVPPLELKMTPKQSVTGHWSWLKKHIIFEDESVMVLNKPSGMAVHGGSGLSLGCIEALRSLYPQSKYLELVHRLDKGTSGVLVLAKKRSVLRDMHELLRLKRVQKKYWTLLMGAWNGPRSCRVDAPLRKNLLKSGERHVYVDKMGKASLTQFKLLERFENACLVEATPLTGRTHQIRVHAAHMGMPILGDEKYGMRGALAPTLTDNMQRMYLHARFYSLESQLLGKRAWQAPLDDKFEGMLEKLRKERL